MDFTTYDICDGVAYVAVPVSRFKTNEISIDFCLPLDAATASANALAVSLLTNSSHLYPDKLAISRELSRLYGATINTVVQKIGDNHCLRIVMSSLDDRFSMGGRISTDCIRMLMSLVFDPHMDDNGDFYAADIEREKRILTERIQSEENEKRIFALNRMQSVMFAGAPYATNKYGTAADVSALTPDDVRAAWLRMLRCARINIVTVGSVDEGEMLGVISDRFATVERRYAPPVIAAHSANIDDIKRVDDIIDVKQGKLVLGFRVDMAPDDADTPAMRAFCDIFGGGPYSKLFANVREKMSLCYYCSARYDRHKSAIIIQCGCEYENMDKAIAEILAQLDLIRQGDFEQEFYASRAGLCDSIDSVADDSIRLQSWYSNQIVDSVIKTPQHSSAENRAVTMDQVQHCAFLISLDTVYKLYGKEDQ